MTLKKAPFRPGGGPKQDVFTIRMSEQERQSLEEWKSLLDVSRDSTAIKILASFGKKVIQGTIGKETLRFLLNKNRARYDYVTPPNKKM